MLKTFLMGAAFAVGMSTIASAAMLPAPVGNGDVGIIRVAEGCGAGEWRGPNGRCHPMARHRVCPRGYHIGRHGRRCWPN